MKKFAFICIAVLGCLCYISCSPIHVDKHHSMTVTYGPQKAKVRLIPITPTIIRVSAVPANAHFSTRPSLMCVDNPALAPTFTVSKTESSALLATDSLQVEVDLHTGRIRFLNRQGACLLEEAEGTRSFEPFVFEGDHAYTVQQAFESPEDEAFYGLGQHQSDEFNYKNKNEVLYQYNTKVSVPFIVSSRHYGLLWDNYSLTKYGDPRDYMTLNTLKLTDTEGNTGALTATYTSRDEKQVYVTRRESEIAYEDLETTGGFPTDIPFYDTKIKWEGTMEADQSGQYRFMLYYAGYTKLFIDDQEVVSERWRTAWNPNTYKFSFDMEKGQQYRVRLEWIPDGGVSYIALKMLTPTDPVQQGRLQWWSEMADMIDYYFVAGHNADQVISGYRTLTGKAPVMPKWAMGFWQSRQRYKTQAELLDVLRTYRQRQIPIDNIVQDWSYWPVADWGSHEFDPERFPDPQGMVDSVHAMDGHIMISVWPKFYHTTQHYKEFADNGWMYLKAVQDSVRDWIYPGYIGSFYDAYAPEARQLFWNQMNEHLFSLGFDAWWMDASEPDIVSNSSLAQRKALSNPTALGSSTRYLNAYGLANAMAIYDGQRGEKPNQRVFLLTRSGFAGLQRYSTAIWSGDIGACWEDMKAQISAGMNFSMSGIPYWTMDIGGYSVQSRFISAAEGSEDQREWRELQTRWHQFGAFCPLFRSHGEFPFREIYNTAPEGHPAYESMLWYNQLRYRLMPYIYTLAGLTWMDDYTIMRALVMDFPNDPNVYDISDQYMFGPSFMVCPVYSYGQRSRSVYLPKGDDWYDFNTGQYTPGGTQITAAAPYERMPLFVRAGSVIPASDVTQSTQDVSDQPLTLLVYTGADGDGCLYEDDGVSYDYEQGSYSRIPFTYKNGTLTIGPRQGSCPGAPSSRVFNVVKITPGKVWKEGETGTLVTYTGVEVTL